MAGKLLLPLLGGSPAVWTTCMVFFQAALLAGYAYAHAGAARLPPGRQAALHLAVLLAPLALLPPHIDPARLAEPPAVPALAVLWLLAASVGAPFAAASATAPLLQRWFSLSGHRAARDPYFLYAASNLGSMLALLGYPLLVEPRLPLRGGAGPGQVGLWSLGYVLLVGLTLCCALPHWRGRTLARPVPPAGEEPAGAEAEPAPSRARRLWWLGLAFVPSSLLLGVTAHVTTDIAAVPLLWVLPMALYLLSFIVVFARWGPRAQRLAALAVPPAVLAGLFLLMSELRLRIWLVVAVHLALLLVLALACHGELARDRPAARHLTGFYLWLSLGGVLGGMFNGLLAPWLFSSLAEYPAALALGWLLLAWRRAPAGRAGPPGLLDGVLAAAGATLLLGLGWLDTQVDLGATLRQALLPAGWREWGETPELWLRRLLVYGPPLLVLPWLGRRPAALGLGLAALLAVAAGEEHAERERVFQGRSFFGVLRVVQDRGAGGYVDLRHGTTLHGRQSRRPDQRQEPVSYYYRDGPIGQVFDMLQERQAALRVAVVGLGTGTLAAYARPGDTMDFYEIDPLVGDIALDPAYFSYVADARARGARVRVELGDARVRLDARRRAGAGPRYDLVVVDAFSSDAIPVHLLTREALRIYLDLLAPDGLLALHISNRHLRLAPVVAALARDAGLAARIQHHDATAAAGADRSSWAVLARSEAALGELAEPADVLWTPAAREAEPGVQPWTDDAHDLLAVLKW
jgi:spermidine synthase